MASTLHGFSISMSYNNGIDPNLKFGRFLNDAMAANGLSFGGNAEEGFVVARNGKTTNEHRSLTTQWLAGEGLSSFEIGVLVDANS